MTVDNWWVHGCFNTSLKFHPEWLLRQQVSPIFN